MIVAKFGGSTLTNAKDFKNIPGILHHRPEIKFIVVSACKGITDQLIKLSSCSSLEKENCFSRIMGFHKNIINSLFLDSNELSNYINKIEIEMKELISSNFSLMQMDQLLSIGERLSSAILTSYLQSCGFNISCLDARKLIITDDNFGRAHPIMHKIKEVCRSSIFSQNYDGIFITQGFIGSTEDGITTTLGREGSDYSAAILAVALDADELEIYKDVAGVYTHDPKIEPGAQLIEKLNYSEMFKISNKGSNVLHFPAIKLCQHYNIPMNIKSIFNPYLKGTLINNHERKAS
ncbi:MAG: hypothetical protein BGO67_03260 [Alphaproteobacteria bacterium 41-28]|nr:MAG: hypothetical protein BGO67_03260 [Alphaproteobacteria bacterium 41-28]